MRAAVLAALALALALPAAAHERPGQRLTHDPQIRWLDAPSSGGAGNGKIRLIFHDPDTRAAVSVNAYDTYQRAYRHSLARRALHGPVGHHAIAAARHDAFHAVLAAYPDITVPGFVTHPVDGARPYGAIFD